MGYKFSLKALFYWLSVWMVSVSLVSAMTHPIPGLVLTTVWYCGTILVLRLFGHWAGVAYCFAIGFLIPCLMFIEVNSRTIPPDPTRSDRVLTLVMLFGIVGGAIVFGASAGADWLFKRLTHGKC